MTNVCGFSQNEEQGNSNLLLEEAFGHLDDLEEELSSLEEDLNKNAGGSSKQRELKEGRYEQLREEHFRAQEIILNSLQERKDE